jgi:hypothetical protein
MTRWLLLIICLSIYLPVTVFAEDGNRTGIRGEIIRVIKPGVFDYQVDGYILRLRAWGVGFPKRGQPGFNDALAFTERILIGSPNSVVIKQEFDLENLKVADIELPNISTTFSKLTINQGVGWHNEKESGRFGPFIMAQLRAKRKNLGVWADDFNYFSERLNNHTPFKSPVIPQEIKKQLSLPTMRYWVTGFGKIHRPECSFYERGRGELSSRPTGEDCRICGGAGGK